VAILAEMSELAEEKLYQKIWQSGRATREKAEFITEGGTDAAAVIVS
jgi:hypothetical protein